MDKKRVKLALHSTQDNICNIIDKFLRIEIFTLLDLSWWWDPNEHWWLNKKYAEVVLRILRQEDCCKRVSSRGNNGYQKTPEFIDLLYEIQIEEELLNL